MTEVHVAAFAELDARTAYLLWQLRGTVFVVEQECPYLDLDGRDLEPATKHLWIGEDHPVAYLRVLEDDGSARVGRVVVDADHRGQRLADQLMRSALDLVGERPCVLDAQAHLAGWYARLGFEQTGREFLDDGIPHVPMRRG